MELGFSNIYLETLKNGVFSFICSITRNLDVMKSLRRRNNQSITTSNPNIIRTTVQANSVFRPTGTVVQVPLQSIPPLQRLPNNQDIQIIQIVPNRALKRDGEPTVGPQPLKQFRPTM